MNIKMIRAMERHGQQLQLLYPQTGGLDPLELVNRLHRHETSLNRLATDYCNGAVDTDQVDTIGEKVLGKVRKLLGPGPAIHFNRDPRGYSLKIDDEIMRGLELYRLHRDWGGYGIICPEF